MLVYSTKKKRAIGWLVLFYYATYIIIEIDFFGFTIGDIFTTHNQFIYWYLVYTAISTIFFVAAITISITTHTKAPLFYAGWILLNMFVSGLSAIFQAFETNDMLFWYNLLQDLNLIVDLTVVIVGTDSIISRGRHIANIIY